MINQITTAILTLCETLLEQKRENERVESNTVRRQNKTARAAYKLAYMHAHICMRIH